MKMEQNTKGVIRKWYARLRFPEIYDRGFQEALETIPVPADTSIATYDLACEDGKKNLLSFLYMCEATEQKYRMLGIGEEILLATLQDIVRWTREWSLVKGELYLGELVWLERIMDARLFRVGRLQFYMAPAILDIPKYGIQKGDNVVELHIPVGGRLDPESVDASLAMGRQFLQTHFPAYRYRAVTCRSWMLDEKLRDYLRESSNILGFASRFDVVASEDSNALIRFLFRWDASGENLPGLEPSTEFTARIKAAVLRGEQFHVSLGVLFG